jgi:hypothetical protein
MPKLDRTGPEGKGQKQGEGSERAGKLKVTNCLKNLAKDSGSAVTVIVRKAKEKGKDLIIIDQNK